MWREIYHNNSSICLLVSLSIFWSSLIALKEGRPLFFSKHLLPLQHPQLSLHCPQSSVIQCACPPPLRTILPRLALRRCGLQPLPFHVMSARLLGAPYLLMLCVHDLASQQPANTAVFQSFLQQPKSSLLHNPFSPYISKTQLSHPLSHGNFSLRSQSPTFSQNKSSLWTLNPLDFLETHNVTKEIPLTRLLF